MKRLLMFLVAVMLVSLTPNTAVAGPKGYILLEDAEIQNGKLVKGQVVKVKSFNYKEEAEKEGRLIIIKSDEPEIRSAQLPGGNHYHTIIGPTQQEMAKWRREDLATTIGGGFFVHNNPDYWWVIPTASVLKNNSRQKVQNRQITFKNGEIYDISYGDRRNNPNYSYNQNYVPDYYRNRNNYRYQEDYRYNYNYYPRQNYRNNNYEYGYDSGIGLGGLGSIISLPFQLLEGILGGGTGNLLGGIF